VNNAWPSKEPWGWRGPQMQPAWRRRRWATQQWAWTQVAGSARRRRAWVCLLRGFERG
jgi:hypothetical protein